MNAGRESEAMISARAFMAMASLRLMAALIPAFPVDMISRRPSEHNWNIRPDGLNLSSIYSRVMRMMLPPLAMASSRTCFSAALMNGETSTPLPRMVSSHSA